MIATHNVHLRFADRKLFEDVNITFSDGNCYGLIGANGAGKSTFLKILSGEIAPTSGSVRTLPGKRLSFLKQDHHAYNDLSVLDCIMLGNPELYQLNKEREHIYQKTPFTDEDGLRASELEAQFTECGGWEAASEAGVLISGLGLPDHLLESTTMSELGNTEKVKVLLAQALFGAPDVLLLDEPTNDLDILAIHWLENFLLDFKNTVIVISHDRHFLNRICTHMADIDFGHITVYTGNYSFWKQASELGAKLRADRKKKAEDKAKELKTFIARFSANAAKSKQATARRKLLDSLDLSALPVSSRKYPYIHFEQHREAGKDLLHVENLTYVSPQKHTTLNDVRLSLNKGDKVLITGEDLSVIHFLAILGAAIPPPEGTSLHWGASTSRSYFPHDHIAYFKDYPQDNLLQWLRRFSAEEHDDTYLRSFLGRMLFSGDDVFKQIQVLSGGERVRCLLAQMMLQKANILILQNPTAHLDLESITALNEGLAQFPGTIIFSSTDHEFIESLCNRFLLFDHTGRLTLDKATDYSSFLSHVSSQST